MTKLRWTPDVVKKRFDELLDSDKYILLEYNMVNSYNSKIRLQCRKCNNIWLVTCNDFFNRGSRCRDCVLGGPKWDKNRLEKEFDNNNKIVDFILLDYNNIHNCDSIFTVRCIHCGSIIKTNCDRFFRRNCGCMTCKAGGSRWTRERVENEFKLIPDNKYYELVSYDNIHNYYSKVTIKCLKCGSIWNVTCGNFFKQNKRCGFCSESIGERKIREYLDSNKIKYIREKRFNDCRNINVLPFDFYVLDYNLLIEFQGEQHFYIDRMFSRTGVSLENLQKRDQIKRKYALDNGYNFLEIHYDEMKWIEQIIYSYLKEHIALFP